MLGHCYRCRKVVTAGTGELRAIDDRPQHFACLQEDPEEEYELPLSLRIDVDALDRAWRRRHDPDNLLGR